ncbi:trypsin-like peptidase [Gelidibacter algens]|uniref:Trypsin-like peptidase n=1 Tax=Gelidibacter algens TaxID=49280 RepID=A0A327SB31_9FLAO|nr:serine protease [Gelidibacter algens]RAJ25134.1 trypsin-like peptidase [Gelidibacter algens]
MKNKDWVFLVFSLFFLSILGCSKDSSNVVIEPPSGIIDTNLIKLEDAVKHPNIQFVNLINKVRGSVGTLGPASKVIWSRKNDYGLGLYISANHVYGVETWNTRAESFVNLSSVNNGIFLGSQIPQKNGNVLLGNEFIADFKLYHPEIPISATNATILPANDFYLGILDNQRINDNGFAVYPENVQTSHPLEIYDPNSRTTHAQTWSNPIEGKTIMVVGYPQDRISYPNGAVSTGKVFTNTDAESIIAQLKIKGDEEGDIPYDSNVEFIANAKSLPGMSGGGVFNSEGQLLGISVRATVLNNEPILRVVKMTYIWNKLSSFYNNLSTTDKNKLLPFVNGEL